MNILNIVDKVSDILNMSVHHFDHRNFTDDYLYNYSNIKGKPLVVAYSDQYSPWCFAIMDDFSVVIPTLSLLKIIKDINTRIREVSPDEEVEVPEELAILDNLKFAEEFLKNSPDSEVLKQFEKQKLTYYY